MTAEDHHRQFSIVYNVNLTPKAHWALHLAEEMKLVGPPRNYSTIRFEGSFSTIKQKSYFNFLNLAQTVANFYAFRESFHQLFSTPALHPGVSFSSPCIVKFEPSSGFSFPKYTTQYSVSSVSFHGSTFKPEDVACFMKSGIIFHSIQKIIVFFSDTDSHCETAEPENTFFICKRLEYQYDVRLHLFRLLPVVPDFSDIFNACQMTGVKPIHSLNNTLYPPTLGRIPQRTENLQL